jgi:hypothetical protein
MSLKLIPFDENESKSIWKHIVERASARGFSPHELARLTGYSILRIQKGFNGEAAEVTDGFLRSCVFLFGLVSGRIEWNNPEDISLKLSREECIRLLCS